MRNEDGLHIREEGTRIGENTGRSPVFTQSEDANSFINDSFTCQTPKKINQLNPMIVPQRPKEDDIYEDRSKK